MPDTARDAKKALARKNRKLALGVVALILVMEVAPWAYAPLYKRVCGLLGITTASSKPVDELLAESRASATEAVVPVTFMGVNGTVPVSIEPLTRHARVETGEVFSVMYRVRNLTDRPIDYKAVHMVEPMKENGFQLIRCFCDDHRVIAAGATEDLPLVFQLTGPPASGELVVNYTLFPWESK